MILLNMQVLCSALIIILCLGASRQASLEAPKVKLELYTESLCPGCIAFIEQQLAPTFKVVADIMDVQIVPYGNAEETQNPDGTWKFTCQHGPRECVGNLVETCAIKLLPKMVVTFPFLLCLEESGSPDTSGPQCAAAQGIDYEQIDQCVNSKQGNEWQHENAVRTANLKPAHQYTPWIVLNGVHTEDIQNRAASDLLGLVCDTYTGPKPKACQ